MMSFKTGCIHRFERRSGLHIREISSEDYDAFLQMLKKLDEENSFLMFEPGEKNQVEIEDRNRQIFVAEADGKLVGHVTITRGSYQHNRHTARLENGVLKKYQNQGIGTQLLEQAIQWAKDHDIKRLELSIMIHNLKAIYLCKKMGFQIEGMRKKSMFVNEKHIDEYYMARLFNEIT